ncbi:MAG: hypothetical protein DHS20C11_23680 [Lysobacteraceae bacterium]|nr:MAG: hypothetical protein DHS20C11_23680 [Xanthomonadaceae bacterium]
MANERRYELDWLRVLAFMVLILFHAGMAFVEFPWHIKNQDTSHGLTILWGFLHGWRMPLLFLISGAGIWFALGKRGALGFIGERSRRLLIPLVFGVLVVVPPQVYLERLSQGVEFSSYLDFYPHFFEGYYFSAEGGNFSPHHLWFIGSLFVYCLVLAPVLVLLRSARGDAFRAWFDRFFARGINIYLLVVPFYLGYLIWPGGFFFNSGSALLIVLGFLLVSSEAIWPRLEALRNGSLLLALVLFALALTSYFSPGGETRLRLFDLLSIPAALTMLFAILGFARRYLAFNNRFLAYANEGVYPYYILHQTFTVIIVYWLVPLNMNLWLKFGLSLAGTVIATALTYHLLIRPFDLIRPLFGLKPNSPCLSDRKATGTVGRVAQDKP